MRTSGLFVVVVAAVATAALQVSGQPAADVVDLLREESRDLQDTLEKFAKDDPVGLQVLRSGIDTALNKYSFQKR